MRDVTNTLEQIGLSDKEASIYLSVLENGESTMTQLAKASGLKRPTAYLAVDRLLALGLFSETKMGKHKVYTAIHPRRLLQIAQLREKQIEGILPKLVALHKSSDEKPQVQMFEGLKGMRNVYSDIIEHIKNKKEVLFSTRIGDLHKHVPDIVTEFKRALRATPNPHVRELNYGDEEGVVWSKETKKLRGENHFVRILPTDFQFGGSDIVIYGNTMAMFSYGKEIFVLVITSYETTTTFRAWFEWTWRAGKEL